MLNHNFGGAHSGSRELRVDVIRKIDVATDLVELDSVRAERRLLLLLAVVMRVIVGMVKDSRTMGVLVAVVMVSMFVAVGISIVLVEERIFRVIRNRWASGMVVWVIMRVVMNVKVAWVIMRMIVGVVVRVVVRVIVIMRVIMGVIMIVIVFMGTLHALDNNIIMRITIIRNEYTSVIIASELDCIRVNLGHGSNDSLTICLKDSSGLGDSSCSKLRVSTWVSCRISSNDVQINAM